MSIARHHAEWLSLVPVSGPFLSLPVLMEAFPQGLDAHDPEHARLLRLAHEEWDDSFSRGRPDPAVHDAWIKFVLTKTLEFDESLLAEGQAIPQTLQVEVPEHGELLKPSIVLNDTATKKARMLVQTYPRPQDLSSYVAGSRWKASPDTRMTDLLHATGVRLGLVTNGEHWMLVDAPKGETTGYASWYASLWREEKITLQAFRSLLSMTRFLGVGDDETIEALLAKSASNQQEVTDQLGLQVRRAVEVLIQSLDKADQDHGRALLEGVSEAVLYESALTVMMRLVFLFCAEERELIPTKPFPVYEQNYSVSTISKQLREIADQHGEELLERRYDAWPRLLSAFRAVYGGLAHDDVYMPAYGGRLFDPDRFPFLEGRQQKTSWRTAESNPLPVNNRTVLHLLEALQFLQVRVPGGGPAEARRLSFRALDIEQIGHVYEGLLDHTAKRATEPTLGLIGKDEPETPLSTLEKQREKEHDQFYEFLKKETGSSRKWENYLDVELDDRQAVRLRTACGNDDALFQRVLPFAGLLRDDTFDYPVVIPKGSVFVTAGTDRRSSGTHYTPRSLTEPIVQYTLEPLVYVGPAEGKPKADWKLKSAEELLGLKICDMACGSGAFLVQAARYMSERLMEAWDAARDAHPDVPGITPEGRPSTGDPNESLIPNEPAECTIFALRIVTQRCLYGVDVNLLAAEMAKLSLWLLTLAKDKPFEFLDHTIRCGDSLIGLHNLDQLRHYCMKPNSDDAVLFKGPLDTAVDDAINLRVKLEGMPANTVADIEVQERLLKEAEDKIARLRCAADLLVAAELFGASMKDKQEKVRHAAVVSGHYVENGPTTEFEEQALKERHGQSIFHWPLEFPEVLVSDGGFDAFIGNPPFKAGAALATLFGDGWKNYVVSDIGNNVKTRRGQFDLAVFFLLQACRLCQQNGFVGAITTNSLAQGDSRIIGLSQLYSHGFQVIRAETHLLWPGAAGTHISLLWVGPPAWKGTHVLDGELVDRISDSLSDDSQPLECSVLIANKRLAFRGAMPYGEGFFVDPSEAAPLLDTRPERRTVLMPYLIGNDLNTDPQQQPRRYIVNFHDWKLNRVENDSDDHPCANDFPELLKIVVERVKPQRLALRANNSTARHRREFWWQFSNRADNMLAAIRDMDRVLAISRTTAHLAFAFVSTNIVLSERLVVIADDRWSTFGLLQSSIHESWAFRPGTMTQRTTPTYFVTEAFETFPRPVRQNGIETDAASYYELRRDFMVEHGIGLTETYNNFNNRDATSADVTDLRRLHMEVDYRVANAYGWDNLDLEHGFHETKFGLRFTISESARREVLHRLLKLNHERYEEEVQQGLHDKKMGRRKKSAPKSKVTGKQERTLFNIEDEG